MTSPKIRREKEFHHRGAEDTKVGMNLSLGLRWTVRLGNGYKTFMQRVAFPKEILLHSGLRNVGTIN